TTLKFTAPEALEGKVHVILNLSDGKGKSDNRKCALAAGESKLFEFPASEGWKSIGYSVQTAEAKVELIEDYREEKDRKPF
ncbi:MAG: hypothetical protein ABFS86_16325, partial [Planctomycetota bacterium]